MTNEMKNNFYMAEDINTQCPHIVAILKAHPIYESLVRTAFVPEVYLYQLWETIEYRQARKNRAEHCKFYLTSGDSSFHFRFDLTFFRETIGFPAADEQGFENIPDENALVRAINDLGYEGEFIMTKQFKRKFLARPWCILYSILNRCLSPSNTGMDSINKPLMKILYGVAYHKQIDFAFVLWEQLLTLVKGKDKQKRNYIPFIRFFTIIIFRYLDTHPNLPKQINNQIVCLHMMKTVQRDTGSVAVTPRPIPDSLLQLVDENDPTIRDYRELNAPMVPAAPQEPAHGANRDAGEGSSGKVFKNKGKRIEGVSYVVVSETEGRTKFRHERQYLDHSEIHSDNPSPPRLKRRKTTARKSSKRDQQSNSEATDSDVNEETQQISLTQNVSATIEIESDPMITTESQQVQMGNDDSIRDFSDTVFEYVSCENIIGGQGGNEGEVENVNISEMSGREIRSKENEDLPLTTPESRENTSATEVHVLHQGIEEDESSQLSHAQNQQRHINSSQQELVLFSHGDKPRLLSPSHLEMRVIETESIPPQLSPSLSALIRSNLRTLHIESSLRDFARLRGVAGTSIETTFNVASRGLLGNPARANVFPTLSAGLLTYPSGGQRYERLCDTASVSPPGMVLELPGSLSDSGVISQSLHGTDRVYERLGDTGHGQTPVEHSMGCKALERTVNMTGNPESVMDYSGHTAGPSDSVVVLTSPSDSGISQPFVIDSTFQERMTHTHRSHTPTPPTIHTTSQPHFFTTSPQTTQFAPSSSSQPTSSLISFNSMSLNELQVLFHAKLLTSTILTPTQSALLAILNNSLQQTSTHDSLSRQFESLSKRVSFLEQTCRPSVFPSSSRHDDPGPEDQHEGENRGMGAPVSFGEQPHVQQSSQQERGTTSGSGSSPKDDENLETDFEDEIYNTEPLNVIYQTLMIEYEKEGDEEMADLGDEFQQEFTAATEEGMSSYVQGKGVIEIDSDEDQLVDEQIMKNIKEEEDEMDVEIEKEAVNVEFDSVIEQFDEEENMFQTLPPKSTHASTSLTHNFPPSSRHQEVEEGELNEEIFDQIVPPNEEVLVELEKDVGESSNSKKKVNEGKFFKDKAVQLDLKSQQLRKTLREPFIEEQAYKIYSKTDFIVHKFNVIGGYLFPNDDGLRNEYHTLMRRMMCRDEKEMEEQRKFRIKSFIEVDCVKLARVAIPRFHVYRTNDKRYVFSEADFHRLPLNEIMDVYDYLRDMILKPWAVQVALETVKRYMKALIQMSALQDFQLGLESVKRKINVTVPNQTLEGYDLESIPTCMIFVEPEKGFVLRNGLGKKNFIRLSELHKYSDGTLALAYKCFHTLLKSKQPTKEEIPLIDEVMDKLHGRLYLRVQIRQIEICRGIRKKMFYKGSQFIKEYIPRGRRGIQGNFPTTFDSLGPYLPNDPRNRSPRQI